MSTPFDQGRSAARKGLPKRSNPFDHPDRQAGQAFDWERKACEWDEGWESFDAATEATTRTANARAAARVRWSRSGSRGVCSIKA